MAGTDLPTPRDPGNPGGDELVDELVIVGRGRVTTVPLGERELVIGRGGGCDVVLDHVFLSRRHAVIRRGPPASVQDLGSTNGTRVGEQTLHGGDPVVLAGGDFHIGPYTFLVMSRSAGSLRSGSGRDLLRVIDPTVDGVSPLVRDVAASGVNVLILGETGVGKEVLTDTIHRLSGRTGELTRINCASLNEMLLESELFGHVKGAFTGASVHKAGILEASRGGTVFLDEVGELPLPIQAKLLRAVEQREVLRLGATKPVPIDVRFVTATNRDLPEEVEAGRFRRDLYFRLDGVTLSIPPLRERRSLIAPLAARFLEDANTRDGRPANQLAPDVLAALERYEWPGNVRELKAVIERAVLLARGAPLRARHLSFTRTPATSAPATATAAAPASAPRVAPASTAENAIIDSLTDEQRADRARLVAALEECAGNQTRAAKLLGISRTTLVTKIRLYRIPRPRA